jgi:hypothetical protein
VAPYVSTGRYRLSAAKVGLHHMHESADIEYTRFISPLKTQLWAYIEGTAYNLVRNRKAVPRMSAAGQPPRRLLSPATASLG